MDEAYLGRPLPTFTDRSPFMGRSDRAVDNEIGRFRNGTSILGAQNSFAFRLHDSDQIVFVGDRWQTAALKSDDLQAWVPLQFDDAFEPPRIQVMKWRSKVELEQSVRSRDVDIKMGEIYS